MEMVVGAAALQGVCGWGERTRGLAVSMWSGVHVLGLNTMNEALMVAAMLFSEGNLHPFGRAVLLVQ